VLKKFAAAGLCGVDASLIDIIGPQGVDVMYQGRLQKAH
jgi:hypothetical protein